MKELFWSQNENSPVECIGIIGLGKFFSSFKSQKVDGLWTRLVSD